MNLDKSAINGNSLQVTTCSGVLLGGRLSLSFPYAFVFLCHLMFWRDSKWRSSFRHHCFCRCGTNTGRPAFWFSARLMAQMMPSSEATTMPLWMPTP